MPTYDARWLQWQWGHGCERRRFYVKALVWSELERPDGPRVFLDMKSPSVRLLQGSEAERWWRWLGDRGAFRDEFGAFDELGAEMDLRPCSRQAVQQGLPHERAQWCAQTPTASSSVFITWLCQCSNRLMKAKRAVAKAILSELLVRSFACGPSPASSLPRQWFANALCEPEECRRWAAGSEGSVVCGHVQKLLAEHCLQGSELRLDMLGALLAKAYREKQQCPLLARWFWQLVRVVSAHFDARVLHWDAGADNLEALRGKRKRCNLDRDAAGVAAHELVASGRYKSLAAAARAKTVDISDRQAVHSENRFVCGYIQETLKHFKGCEQLCLMFDESSVSKEPTLVAQLYDRLSGDGVQSLRREVVPALKTTLSVVDEPEEVDAAMEARQTEMATLLREHEGAPRGRTKLQRGFGKPSISKVATYQLIRALDHSLQLAGLSLLWFADYEERSRVLKEGELRYMADVEPWATYEVGAEVRWRRVIRKCLRTGQKFWESPAFDATARPRLLVLTGDESAINLSAVQTLTHGMGLRCVFLRDGAHRTWRDAQMALQEAGAWGDILEALQCMSFKQGPWSSASFHKQTEELAREHLERAGPEDGLFVELFDRLAEEYEGQVEVASGMFGHRDALWRKLVDADFLHGRGTRVTMTRWFQWCEAWKAFDAQFFSHMYYYNLLSLTSGLKPNVVSLPIFDVPIVKQQLMLGKRKTMGKNMSMQQSLQTDQLEEGKVRYRSSLELICVLMGQPHFQRRCRMAYLVLKPLWTSYSKEYEAISKASGLLNHAVGFATLGYSYPLRKVWGGLTCPDSLDYLKFAKAVARKNDYASQMGTASAGSSAAAPMWSPCMLRIMEAEQEDCALAAHFFRLACRVVAHRSMSMNQWCEQPPLMFAGLLARPEEHWAASMARAQRAWEALLAIEHKAQTHRGLRQVVQKIGWFFCSVSRSVLCQLAQHQFLVTSPAALSMVSALFRGPQNSVCVERAFQTLEGAKHGHNKNGKLRRTKRLYSLVTSGLAAQMGGDEVQPDGSCVKDRELPSGIFDALGMAPSLDEMKVREAIANEGREWPSTNAVGLQLQTAAWCLVRELHEAAQLELVDEAWHALLLSENEVWMHRPSGDFFLCLKVSAFAALVWPVNLASHGGIAVFEICVAEGVRASWRAVVHPDDWLWQPVQVLPRSIGKVLGCHAGAGGVTTLLLAGERANIWCGAAQRGFAHVTGEHLDQIIRRFGVLDGVPAAQKPRLVLEKTECLVRHFLPGLTQEELAAIMRARSGLFAASKTSLLVGNVDLVQPHLDQSDARDCQEWSKRESAGSAAKARVAQYLREKEMMTEAEYEAWLRRLGRPRAAAAAAPSEGDAHAGGAAGAGERAQPAKQSWSWTESWLKDHIPQGVGATIGEVLNVHTTSWSARYPNAPEGFRKTCTRSYGAARSSAQAAQVVFAWVWQAHEAATGESCPWQLPPAARDA